MEINEIRTNVNQTTAHSLIHGAIKSDERLTTNKTAEQAASINIDTFTLSNDSNELLEIY